MTGRQAGPAILSDGHWRRMKPAGQQEWGLPGLGMVYTSLLSQSSWLLSVLKVDRWIMEAGLAALGVCTDMRGLKRCFVRLLSMLFERYLVFLRPDGKHLVRETALERQCNS